MKVTIQRRKRFVAFVVTLCFVGVGFLAGIQKYGSDITKPCKPPIGVTGTDEYTWVFGYPFPALKQDQMAGDCNGEDNYGTYRIDPWGTAKDTALWSIAGGVIVSGLVIAVRRNDR